MRLIICISVLMLLTSCVPARPEPGRRDKQPKSPIEQISKTDFVVFLTGYGLGALKPCGCSGGQLGGFDRRWAVLNSVPLQRKLIIDTGSLVESDSEQDLIKFSIMMQAFDLLNYDLVNLAKKDLEIAQNLGLLDNPVVGFISPYGADEKIAGKFQNQYLLNDEYITISVFTFDVETTPIEQIREVFLIEPDKKYVNILIINKFDKAIISSLAEIGVIDCVICPSDSDEPRIISDPNDRPLVFTVGRFGRYVCMLNIRLTEFGGGLELGFHSIPVVENLKQGQSLVQLYKDYQQLVKEANLLEKFPRFALPNGLQYVGSKSCKPCHKYEYRIWSQEPHARAYKTLKDVGSHYDPECVVCHVVGMDYQSGFVSEKKTNHLKDVGCENCHGPGSEHNRTLGLAKTAEPKSDCLYCHTPEKSAEYAGNEEKYLEKIRHWKELKTASNVQQ